MRIANIAHSTTDVGFLPMLIALAKQQGYAGYPGDGANLWNAVHARDVASPFRLALEKGPAGSYWHAVEDGGGFRLAGEPAARFDLDAVASAPPDMQRMATAAAAASVEILGPPPFETDL